MDAAVTATKQLRSMGFDQRSIDKYLCAYPYSFTEEKSLDYLVSRAVSWLSTQKSSQDPVIDSEGLKRHQDMGFSVSEPRKSLIQTGGNASKAANHVERRKEVPVRESELILSTFPSSVMCQPKPAQGAPEFACDRRLDHLSQSSSDEDEKALTNILARRMNKSQEKPVLSLPNSVSARAPGPEGGRQLPRQLHSHRQTQYRYQTHAKYQTNPKYQTQVDARINRKSASVDEHVAFRSSTKLSNSSLRVSSLTSVPGVESKRATYVQQCTPLAVLNPNASSDLSPAYPKRSKLSHTSPVSRLPTYPETRKYSPKPMKKPSEVIEIDLTLSDQDRTPQNDRQDHEESSPGSRLHEGAAFSSKKSEMRVVDTRFGMTALKNQPVIDRRPPTPSDCSPMPPDSPYRQPNPYVCSPPPSLPLLSHNSDQRGCRRESGRRNGFSAQKSLGIPGSGFSPAAGRVGKEKVVIDLLGDSDEEREAESGKREKRKGERGEAGLGVSGEQERMRALARRKSDEFRERIMLKRKRRIERSVSDGGVLGRGRGIGGVPPRGGAKGLKRTVSVQEGRAEKALRKQMEREKKKKEKELEKELKRKNRQKEKEEKAREKAKNKEEKRLMRTISKQTTKYNNGTIWFKEIRVVMDGRLNPLFQNAIKRILQKAKVEIKVTRLSYPNMITFEKVKDRIFAIRAPDDVAKRIDKIGNKWSSFNRVTILCYHAETFLEHVNGTMRDQVARILRNTPNTRVNITVIGLDERLLRKHAPLPAHYSIRTYQDVQEYLSGIHISSFGKQRGFLLATPNALGDYIMRFTKGASGMDHLKRSDKIALSRCDLYKGEARTFRISWKNYLRKLKRLSEPYAELIVDAYPTFRHLREAYLRCGKDVKKGECLLQDLRHKGYANQPDGQRLGPQRSKLVYWCIIKEDPNHILD